MSAKELIDLHIVYSSRSDFLEILSMLKKFHYKIIAVEGLEESIGNLSGIKIFKRITIEASSEYEAKKKLRGIKKRYDVVALKPKSYGAARLAARDGRVDLIPVDEETLRYIDLSEIRLLKEFGGAFEISLFTIYKNRYNVRFNRFLQKKIQLLIRYDAPIVVVSGARNMYELWHPKQIIGILVLYGMSEYKALDTITLTPQSILSNRS